MGGPDPAIHVTHARRSTSAPRAAPRDGRAGNGFFSFPRQSPGMRSSSRVRLAAPVEAPAFLLVGGLGFLVDLGLTLALAPVLGAFAARPPAIAIAVLATFALNRSLTFRAGGGRVRAQLPRYLAACAASQALNYAVYSVVLALAGTRPPVMVALAAVAGSAAAAGLTFLLAKKWAFAAP